MVNNLKSTQMKKHFSDIYSFRLAFFPVIVLVVTSMALLTSCRKNNSQETVTTVSGAFLCDSIRVNDSVFATVIFTFDEQTGGTVNGGVVVVIRGDSIQNAGGYNQALHSLSKWEKTGEGSTVFEGSCDFGQGLGKMSFSGVITRNESLSFTLYNGSFHFQGTAVRNGKYYSSGENNSDYVGEYTLYCEKGNVACVDPFNLTMVVTSSSPASGGLELQGYFVGEIPFLSGPKDIIIFHYAVLFGDLIMIGADGPGGMFGFGDWWPDPNHRTYGGSYFTDCMADRHYNGREHISAKQ
jgi:hypothetical protein